MIMRINKIQKALVKHQIIYGHIMYYIEFYTYLVNEYHE